MGGCKVLSISNSKIENRALNALENIIDDHNTMSHQFNSLDKEMSWDGFILIYKDNEKSTDKSNFDDELRVQIKGHIDDLAKNSDGKYNYLGRKKITYSVSLADLKIYSKNGGVLYFEIFMTPDGKRREVFYASLYPSILKKYIDEKEMKLAKKKTPPKNPSTSIVFTRLKNDANVLYEIAKQFCIEKGQQGTGEVPLVKDMIMLKDIDKVESISATIVGTNNEFEILKKFASGDVCFYGTTEGNPYKRPIEWIRNAKFIMCKEVERSISIGNMMYYDKYEIEGTSDDELIIILSPNLRIDLSKNKFNFTSVTSIKELKNDARFLLETAKTTSFKINNSKFSYTDLQMPKELEEELNFYLELDEAFSMIELEFDKPFKDLSEKILKQLADLVRIKKGLKNNILTEKSHIYNWMLGDKYVPIIVTRHDNDEKNDLCNAIYTKKYQTSISNDKNEHFIVPLLGRINEHIIKKLYRYDYEYLKEQIDKEDINEYTAGYLNQVGLKLISIFDENNDFNALELAQYQFDKINEIEANKPYFIINLLQLKKRREGLIEQDLQKINNITASDSQIVFGIKVLLEDKKAAKKIFKDMDKETQDSVEKMPIYYLYENI